MDLNGMILRGPPYTCKWDLLAQNEYYLTLVTPVVIGYNQEEINPNWIKDYNQEFTSTFFQQGFHRGPRSPPTKLFWTTSNYEVADLSPRQFGKQAATDGT